MDATPAVEGVGAPRAWRLPIQRPALRLIAVVTLFGAEAIHTAAMAPHWRGWALAGWFFLAVSVVEGVLAAALLIAATPGVARVAVAASLATAAAWAISRLWGVPFGPFPGPESVGVGDSICTGLELITALALLPFLSSRHEGDSRGRESTDARLWPRPAASVAVVSLAVLFSGIAVVSVAKDHDHHDHRAGAPSGVPAFIARG